MYLALKAGKTSLLNRAQWGQLAEAYSITVTGALGEPRVMSSLVAVVSGAAMAAPPSPSARADPISQTRARSWI